MTASLAIVGAGPRGVGILERVGASASELVGDLPLRVHLVDPHPPGGGRVWRADQSALLRLNSTAEDVTLFVDDTVRCEGPIVTGPSFHEWALLVRDAGLATPSLTDEVRALEPMSFPTRHLGNAYLEWVYDRVVAGLPVNVTVEVHAQAAIDVLDLDDGRQRIVLDDGSTVDTDAVVLTIGHLDAEPDPAHVRPALTYLEPAYGADVDLTAIRPGQDVIVRGLGLAFVDVQVLLTEGRGGRFEELGDGRLRYHPSGDEPILHAGSRRGVPYRSKPMYHLLAPKAPLPRFFTRAVVDELAARGPISFRRDVWPVVAKEIAWAAYHELFRAHPDRVALSWDDFTSAYAPQLWGSDELDDLVRRAIPDPGDRLDFDALDRPLRGLRFDDEEQLQVHLRAHIRADIDRRRDPRFSADRGAYEAFLDVFNVLPFVLGSKALSAKSLVDDFGDWWFGFFSYYASGPPPRRLEELLALSEAGIVRFLGEDLRIDVADDGYRAASASTSGVVVATALVDATLPKPTVERSRDPLVRSLAARGELAEVVHRDHDGSLVPTGQIRVDLRDARVVDADGNRHPRRFALGHHTSSRAPAFARPHTNAPALRHNDACARAILRELAAIHDHELAPAAGGR